MSEARGFVVSIEGPYTRILRSSLLIRHLTQPRNVQLLWWAFRRSVCRL